MQSLHADGVEKTIAPVLPGAADGTAPAKALIRDSQSSTAEATGPPDPDELARRLARENAALRRRALAIIAEVRRRGR